MSNPTHNSLDAPRNQNLIAAVLLLFFFVISALSVRKMHTTTDEPSHYTYGESILNGDATRHWNSLMPVSAWNALPAKIASYLPDGNLKDYLEKEISARLMTTLFSLAIAALIFHWTRELYGFIPAIISLALYVFDPNMIAHSGVVTTDIYVIGAIAFSTYRLWKFINSRKWQDGLWLAAALGFAQVAKYTSIVLYPLFIIALLASDYPAMEAKIADKGKSALLSEAWRYVKYAVIGASVGILVINIGFLFHRTFTPLRDYEFLSETFKSLQSKVDFIVPTPYPFLYGLDWTMRDEQNGAAYGNLYLLGKTHPVEGFIGYYVIAAGLKVPIATQIITWAALIVYFSKKKWAGRFLQNEWLLLLPVAFYATYFNFFYNGQIGIRHYLVIFPLLYVFTGSLFREWERFTRAQIVVLGILGLYLAASTLSHYPNYIAYFNEIVWDQKMAYKYVADSNIEWGQDINTLDEYLATHNVYKLPEIPYQIRKKNVFYVSVNKLVGVTSNPPDTFAWVTENFEPTGMIAPSYLLFEFTPEQIQDLCSRTEYCKK